MLKTGLPVPGVDIRGFVSIEGFVVGSKVWSNGVGINNPAGDIGADDREGKWAALVEVKLECCATDDKIWPPPYVDCGLVVPFAIPAIKCS